MAATATTNDASATDSDFVFNDGAGAATGTGQVSAPVTTVRERAGDTDHTGTTSGRVYTIHVTATFNGTTCQADFCVRTPHDMRQENRDWVPCQSQYPSPGPAAS